MAEYYPSCADDTLAAAAHARRAAVTTGDVAGALMLITAGEWLVAIAPEDPDDLAALALRTARALLAASEKPPRSLNSTWPGTTTPGWTRGSIARACGTLIEAERRVALLTADGHTNRSAASGLSVSVNTTCTHLRMAAFAKLGVQSRARLANALRSELAGVMTGLSPRE